MGTEHEVLPLGSRALASFGRWIFAKNDERKDGIR